MFTEQSVNAATRALQSVHGSTIRLYPEFEVCPVCGKGLQVYKTKVRSIVSLGYGFFNAQEVELYCPNGCVWYQGDRPVRIYRSQFLANLVAPWHTYAFDVVAKVGTLRFLECRQRVEIQTEIEKKCGLFIPEGSIQELIRRYVDTIRALHEAKVPKLRESFEDSGGYILYVDGTCEEGSQVHFVCLTGPEPIALWSEKIDSENAIQIRRVLQEVDNRFGRPAAIMEDLSSAIENAVREQWPNIPIFYCHQHFLSDVGKDILDDHYKRFRALLRRSEIRPELARFLKTIKKELGEKMEEARWICQHLESPDLLKGKGRSMKATSVAGGIAEWILSARVEGTGRGFPYDLPHLSFYLRIQRALGIIDKDIVPHLTGRTPRGEKLLLRLRGILHCFLKSRTLAKTVWKIQETNEIFMRLRDSLRLAAHGSGHGMNAVSIYKTSEEAREAEEAVTRFRNELCQELEEDLSSNVRKSMEIIVHHLDKYWDGLFGHCLNVSNEEERYLMVQRTNNMSERFFRGVKRFERRISGKKKLNREVGALPGHALLVFNLKSESYVKLVCGSLEQLPEAFAELARQGKFPKHSDKEGTGKILDRKSLRRPDFPNSVAAAFVRS